MIRRRRWREQRGASVLVLAPSLASFGTASVFLDLKNKGKEGGGERADEVHYPRELRKQPLGFGQQQQQRFLTLLLLLISGFSLERKKGGKKI